jgi:hypothetical protein
VNQQAVNPAQAALFPWLANMARLFDRYEFENLEFIFRPAVGTDTDGKFLATFDPDVLDEWPDSKTTMMEAKCQLDAVPWANATLRVPKEMLAGARFVRPGSVPAGADQHVYDVGVLNIATPGVPVGMLGEFFVKYRVRLIDPTGAEALAGKASFNTATTPAAPLGTAAGTTLGNLWPVRVSTTSFKIPIPGCFFVEVLYAGTTFAGAGSLGSTGENSGTQLETAFSAAAAMATYVLTVVDPEDVYTIVSPAGAATVTGVVFRMSPYDADFV